ncbi:MAG: cellulase family glycosylhydrolase, partial [Kiritimatiellales bacterium]
AEAEKDGLGLIPSLFWSAVAVPDFVGEPLSELGNPKSRSRAFIRKYTTDVVRRYRNSPAIYGWELGNEYLLMADLPGYDHLPPKKSGTDQPRTKADKLFRPMILSLYEDFYQTIRNIDPDRIIITGDSIARAHAWHNRHEDRWGQDSRTQWLEQFKADTPACYKMVSFHLYEEADGKYFKGENLPLEKFVQTVVKTCRKEKKPVWCGELGMPGTDEKSRTMFFRMMKAVEENQVDLSAVWNFIPEGRYQPDWDITPDNKRSYMLDAVKELNRRFAVGVEN